MNNPLFSRVAAFAFAALALFVLVPSIAIAQESESTGSTSSTVSREQVRETLIELLNNPANIENGFADDDSTHIAQTGMVDGVPEFASRLTELLETLPQYIPEFKAAFSPLAYPENQPGALTIAFLLFGLLVVSVIIERLVISGLLQRVYTHANACNLSPGEMIKYALIRTIIHLLGLAVAFIVFNIGETYLFNDNENLYFFTNLIVIAYFKFRIWVTFLRVALSPQASNMRFLPLNNKSANKLYFWGVIFLFLVSFSNVLNLFLHQSGMPELYINGLNLVVTLLFNLIILFNVWSMRTQISGMILSHTESNESTESNELLSDQPRSTLNQIGLLQHLMVGTWPYVLTLWLLLLWVLWQYKSFLGYTEHAQFVSLSWWVTLAFPLADRIFNLGVRSVTKIQWLHSPHFEMRSARFINNVQIGFRMLLIVFGIYLLSRGTGYDSEVMMAPTKWASLVSSFLDVFVLFIISYVFWEFANAYIEKNLPIEEDALAALDNDGGGEGGSRAETLLPMIRTILTFVMGVMLLLVMLHSFGISIAPLLAGAGIFGLAVGFGAQKLVQDFLSGVFFLIDDAFRRGEYIEVENIRGTVESISVRSMQLRHHLGAVQTVPYGEIKTVRNLSRDWITMKLELRLSYETDIERVRKIIKKVGQEMLENEEIGPGFILPLKSQGVMRVEESALIVRMKFTCKPGEQWVIRREAYRRVRDELARQGIHFAHREVRIRLSEEEENQQRLQAETKQQVLSRGAAAAASVIAAEATRHGKHDSAEDGDSDFGGDDR